MFSNEIRCSVNPSNLVAPIKINPKFYKEKSAHIEQVINSDSSLNNILSYTRTIYLPSNDAFSSVRNGYIRPLVTHLRNSNKK